MVDDPTFLFKFSGNIPVSITAKFLSQCYFNFLNNDFVVKELAILVYGVGAWFYTARAATTLVIMRAGRKRCPLKQLTNRNTSACKGTYNPFSLFS